MAFAKTAAIEVPTRSDAWSKGRTTGGHDDEAQRDPRGVGPAQAEATAPEVGRSLAMLMASLVKWASPGHLFFLRRSPLRSCFYLQPLFVREKVRQRAHVGSQSPSASRVGSPFIRSFSSSACCASMMRRASAMRGPRTFSLGDLRGISRRGKPYDPERLARRRRPPLRSRKYFRTKPSSRPGKGASHAWHATSLSTISGPASPLTT